MTVNVKLDPEPIMAAWARIKAAMDGMAIQMKRAAAAAVGGAPALQRLEEQLKKDRAVYVAGLQARYYVRGGLDTRYRDDPEMCAMVRRILRGEELEGLGFGERAQVAAGFITGWTQHQGSGRSPSWAGSSAPPDVPVQRIGASSPQAVLP